VAKSVAYIVEHGVLREVFTVLSDIPLGWNRAYYTEGRCTGKNFLFLYSGEAISEIRTSTKASGLAEPIAKREHTLVPYFQPGPTRRAITWAKERQRVDSSRQRLIDSCHAN
jgi:hypothetical protein